MSNPGPEYKTLEQCYPTLVTCIQQSPSDVVDQLIPSSILAQQDLAFLRNSYHNAADKARTIVDIVMTQVQSNPEVFHVFTEALKAVGTWTSTIVKLEQMYQIASEQPSLWLEMPEPTPEEFCALPVEKVWYQLGLWLGVDKSELQSIKNGHSRFCGRSKKFDDYPKATQMLKAFLQSSSSNEDYIAFMSGQPAEHKKILAKYFLKNDLTHAQNCKAIIDSIRDSEARALGKKLINNKLLKRKQIVDALIRVGLCKVAEKMFTLNSKGISFSFSDYLGITNPANNPPGYVLEYASYLGKRYQQMSVIPDNDWPPSTTSDYKYSQLALVISKPIHYHAVESMEQDYIHGNVDRIVAQKESITLDELFYPIINQSTNTSRLTILMDGAPGVGKTTIARKLCIDWANGDLLQEYQLVVYIPLREAVGDSVATLLPGPTKVADKIAEYLEQLNISGNNTLFIFDGFDELSSKDRSRKSLFMRIIKGDILPECSVLVASRPYASSQSLSSLLRINRHVEVLGFSISDIKQFITKNLSPPEMAIDLIKKLAEERLDILSLCYIPLNCKIVLFVFEQQQYKLPTTLTELYETFILHTIKRSVEKDESDLKCDVNCIKKLPTALLSALDELCKVAFDCLCKDKLYLETESGKRCLSLGLLNSLQAMNSRSLPEEHYQFLHLTIQEFLAARYLSSEKYTEDRHKFLLEHIDDVRYRMTLFFLAGLTKLNFIPSNTSLLGDQTIDLSQKDNWQSDQQKLMLVAHLLFESQIKSLGTTPLKFASNTLTIRNADRLSPFDQLVLAHFLSSTPKNHIWNEIDISDYRLSSDFSLYTTTLSHTKTIAIRMTKCLRLNEITLPEIIKVMHTSATLKELHCTIYISLSSCKHDEVLQLCSAISESNSLETVCIYWKCKIEISKKKFSLSYRPEMCPKSLIKLLEFVKGDSLECIEITNKYAFQDCTSCQSLGSQAVDSLCRVLERSVNIEHIDLSHYELNSEFVGTIITTLSSKRTLKKLALKLDDCILNSNSREILLKLLGTGTELNFYGMYLKPDETCLQIEKTDRNQYNRYKDKIEVLFSTNQFPEYLETVEFVDIFLSHQTVTSFLKNNRHLHKITFEGDWFSSVSPNPNCENTFKMIDTLTAHSNLQHYSGPVFRVSKQILYIGLFEHICVASAKMLLKFLDSERAEEITIHHCPEDFRACTQSSPETLTTIIETLCGIIRSGKCLRSIDLWNCKLNEHFMEMIISSLVESPSEHLESISLSGNDINAESVTKLLQVITSKNISLRVYSCLINIQAGEHLTIECYSSYCSELNHLLGILSCPREINDLTVSSTNGRDRFVLDMDAWTSLLAANPDFVEITLPPL